MEMAIRDHQEGLAWQAWDCNWIQGKKVSQDFAFLTPRHLLLDLGHRVIETEPTIARCSHP